MIVHQGIHPSPQLLWEQIITQPPKVLAFDTEVVSLKDRRLLGIGVAPSGDDAFYVPADDPRLHQLLRVLRDATVRQVWHNAPFDIRVLRKYNIAYSNIDDTAVMLRLLGQRAVLEDASVWVGRQAVAASAVLAQHSVTSMDKLPFEALAKKCCDDAQVTYLLYEKYKDTVPQSYYERERQLIPLLETLSRVGIHLDVDRLEELYHYYSREYAWYLTQAQGLGFEPSKPQQVGYILAERGNFLPFTHGRKQLSTDEHALRKLQDPVARLVLLYRHVAKMLNTYIVPLRGHDRAFTSFHMDALTGRVSSTNAGASEPDRNLQNIPKKVERGDAPTVRSAFIPDTDDKVLTRADLSQIELRVLAYLSHDQNMQSVFTTGGDFHKATAEAMGIHRDYAKIFNFALVYGGDEYVIADQIGTADMARVKKYMRLWMATYPQAAQWITVQKIEGLRNGYVESLYGRRMPIPTDMGQAHAEHCAVNFPIQCSAGEIFKMVLLECGKELLPALRLQVHDEMVFSGEVRLPPLEDISPVHTPVTIEYLPRWG